MDLLDMAAGLEEYGDEDLEEEYNEEVDPNEDTADLLDTTKKFKEEVLSKLEKQLYAKDGLTKKEQIDSLN